MVKTWSRTCSASQFQASSCMDNKQLMLPRQRASNPAHFPPPAHQAHNDLAMFHMWSRIYGVPSFDSSAHLEPKSEQDDTFTLGLQDLLTSDVVQFLLASTRRLQQITFEFAKLGLEPLKKRQTLKSDLFHLERVEPIGRYWNLLGPFGSTYLYSDPVRFCWAWQRMKTIRIQLQKC